MTSEKDKRRHTVQIDRPATPGGAVDAAEAPPPRLRESPAKRRLEGQLLAGLVCTNDEDLGAFRRLRLGLESEVTDPQLALLREHLRIAAHALQDPTDDFWEHLEGFGEQAILDESTADTDPRLQTNPFVRLPAPSHPSRPSSIPPSDDRETQFPAGDGPADEEASPTTERTPAVYDEDSSHGYGYGPPPQAGAPSAHAAPLAHGGPPIGLAQTPPSALPAATVGIPPAAPLPSDHTPLGGIHAVPSGPIPSGPLPSGPVPSGPVPSGPVPSGPVPSGPVPSGPAPSAAIPSGAHAAPEAASSAAETDPWVRPWGKSQGPSAGPPSVDNTLHSLGPAAGAGGITPAAADGYPAPAHYDPAPYDPHDPSCDAIPPATDTDPSYDAIAGYPPLDVPAPPRGQDEPPASEPTYPHRSSHPEPSPPPAAVELDPIVSLAHGLALSVDEYAGLCAERDHQPPHAVAAIHRRYDIHSSAAWEATRQAFALRFSRDPALRHRWEQVYYRFAAYLRQRR